ncbi:hemolysin III family protein [Peribacillus butanolivorans]|uniref:PAQR family membrane homeostasis protein TrhA n=1 Tax=Peribacillus TaxID=2675229 RepID=UPI0006F7E737|nr:MULTISPECIES: hemolysin III family protein [unclassified Peribacillus]KQU25242.1 hemolysin D [Bacillus sp. Leaf13]KRF61046.1 hemolysin D [Bacillus sp. Soil768D1]MBK5463153.1 hemolysin III family protein [Peribacillus sp. TH27]MBK5483504.1 hemolysin III family protein [Peribacillus sp. TH16]MBK5442072.1 hemolysin III family protein [Peribacillus sp. TH24]
MANTHVYTKKEEVVNAITHGVGVLLSIAALVFLIIFSVQKGSAWHVVISVIYGVSMLLLYVSSTLVHSFPAGKTKDLFEIFDHSAIYLFIAGTYTPIMLLVIQGTLGWTLLGIVWGVAVIGVVFKAFFVKKFLFLSTILYIAMGWLIVIAWGPLSAAMPSTGIQLLVAGGLLYTFGAVFYVWRGFPYHHAVWHLFVLAGSVAHFFAVLFYIIPL